MIISGTRSTVHPLLWQGADDVLIKTSAQTRNMVGEFFEIATATAFNGRRHKTDGAADVCPDVSFGDRIFGESKAIGLTGSVIVYRVRHNKDERFESTGARLFYFLWNHATAIDGIKTRSELRRNLARSVVDLIVVSRDAMEPAFANLPCRILNSAYTRAGKPLGYGAASKGYGDGWSIPLNALRGVAPIVRRMPMFAIDDALIGNVDVRFDHLAAGAFASVVDRFWRDRMFKLF